MFDDRNELFEDVFNLFSRKCETISETESKARFEQKSSPMAKPLKLLNDVQAAAEKPLDRNEQDKKQK